MTNANKYVVRQPIKDLQGTVLGYEIRYTGESAGYAGDNGQDFAAADTIYNFLTQTTDKSFSGSLNFMSFTVNLLMKRTCLRNVCFPMEISGVPKDQARRRAL